MDRIRDAEQSILRFHVDRCSSCADRCGPENILYNKPSDQSSRWTSSGGIANEFLVLKLERLSVIQSITFGKFIKGNLGGLKEFRLFAGPDLQHLEEILHATLRADEEPETINTKYAVRSGVILPSLYVKIQCISSWGTSPSFTIWFVQLQGIDDIMTTADIMQAYEKFGKDTSMRICMKYLRSQRQTEALQLLQKNTNVQLEHAVLSSLYDAIVVNGDFDLAMQILANSLKDNHFVWKWRTLPYSVQWTRIHPKAKGPKDYPRMRGGHQMCIDSEDGFIYLFGGWDGQNDLGDFWCYDIKKDDWTLISENTEQDGGPSPRSCHKICFDQAERKIYTLGRYVDLEDDDGSIANDFYCYDIKQQKWSLISKNTAIESGPGLIYDHQMCIDSLNQIIYVFGGRQVSSTHSEVYSGLFSFDLRQSKWSVVRTDGGQQIGTVPLRSRIGHSMLLHEERSQLYIFAGQRSKEYLSDFLVYDLKRSVVEEISRDSSQEGGPEAGFTQRATINTSLNEIYVLSGLMRERNTNVDVLKNTFWVYDLEASKWFKVFSNAKANGIDEPCPRFAHQLVYDSVHKVHYLFGGNPGESSGKSDRLDDFWSLSLQRPAMSGLLHDMEKLVMKQRFRELCVSGDSMGALQYLQNVISPTVNHTVFMLSIGSIIC
eukprot:TRINITY_DN2953_c0_g1_i3.p1 TRINITY_DN2953_c0_g1~~TRINITY_DN2953_c0_g1_i3.p1  ORF type:complete len:659 (-),score=113.86 TRINITY_DN2953_c0_g1_i3:63-2039(-)